MPPLEALARAGHNVALVVTQPDRKRGRGGGLQPSPVKHAAAAMGIPVSDRVDDAIELDCELGVVVAFGKLIKAHVLERLPMVNLHFSLLPRWRGAAPVERAILAGDDETGVCLMALDVGLDTGPVYACERVAIGPDETADGLRERLVELGTALLLSQLDAGLGVPAPQVGEPTYAAKIDPSELQLDFDERAEVVNRTVRLGRAWTTFRDSRLHVLEAHPLRSDDSPPGGKLDPGVLDGVVVGCGGATFLELRVVKPEGRQAQPAVAWLNGARPKPGERLGLPG